MIHEPPFHKLHELNAVRQHMKDNADKAWLRVVNDSWEYFDYLVIVLLFLITVFWIAL